MSYRCCMNWLLGSGVDITAKTLVSRHAVVKTVGRSEYAFLPTADSPTPNGYKHFFYPQALKGKFLGKIIVYERVE